jgi:hypothetical protein
MSRKLGRQFEQYQEPSPEKDKKVPLARERDNDMTNWRFERSRAAAAGVPRWWRAGSR